MKNVGESVFYIKVSKCGISIICLDTYRGREYSGKDEKN